MRKCTSLTTFILTLCIYSSDAFNTLSIQCPTRTSINNARRLPSQLYADPNDNRREALRKVGKIFGVIASVNILQTNDSSFLSHAAETKPPTVWKSGKAPVIPGQKPKDKNDVTGTRKDGNFLRSISNCKSQCEGTNGPDGLARSKEECLSDCQDICCTTYEQCTFGIVPRI